jgi:hypothetical protein
MRSFCFVIIALCGCLALNAGAQSSTNAPATEIENFELQTDTVMVKGFGQTGSVTTDDGVISVRCKESHDVTTGRKLYGISVALDSNQVHGFLVVDYDELDALIKGLNYLSSISYDVTPLPSFDASFTTRSGLRIGAHSERRQGVIEIYMNFAGSTKVTLTSDQFAQFQNLINQARTSLDVTRGKNSSP